jgi:hypothetical protein
VSARDELLATGHLGPEGAALLYELVGLVGVARRFPPPEGSATWDDAAQHTAAHKYLENRRTPRRLLDMALRSGNDRIFEAQMEKAVVNHFRDQARATDLGKLIVRVKEVLREANGFVAIPRAGEELWTFDGLPNEPSTTPAPDLAAAIRAEPIVVPRWTSATRDAPLADRDTFVRLIRSVLGAAEGSLTAPDIARTLTTRLDHRRVPLTVELDTTEGLSEPADPTAGPAASTLARIRAAEIFDPLSDRQRIILLNLDLGVRELGYMIGTGKSQAAELRQQLTVHLIAELEDDDDQQGTARALTELCNQWLQRRTTSTDGTSE